MDTAAFSIPAAACYIFPTNNEHVCFSCDYDSSLILTKQCLFQKV